jgi:outer membrane protein OmpA-like peptidoglycan-associated protein
MKKFIISKAGTVLMMGAMLSAGLNAHAQQAARVQPTWWFGESGAANFNYYGGNTQILNSKVTAPMPFHKGDGVKPYASLLTEYRPNKTWGGMLNIAFDNRGGKFDTATAPCNCGENLSTNLSYVSIEPSVRFAPFKSSFYIFAGPTLGINVSKHFTYTQDRQTDKRGDFSDIRKTVLSAQAGAGVDIPLSAKSAATQLTLSPFASFQTNLGQSPRKVESWSVYTLRAGVALKFGTGKKTSTVTPPVSEVPVVVPVTGKEVSFSVRAPKLVPLNRQVKETFPLRNSIFFNMGESEIPSRYVMLTKPQASAFKEAQLQEGQPVNLNSGRSSRQLAVYHNLLNIVGDRLRSNPQSSILLTGASDKDPVDGKLMAEKVKQYLVNIFGVDGSRIATAGRDKPLIPSEQPGATKELDLLREGDRRVDITSTSPEMLMQVGGINSAFLKPVQITSVQEDPLDSHVIFNTGGANELLKSWSFDLTDEQGITQHYGPYNTDQASIPGKSILGNNSQGNYKVMMTGETKAGQTIKNESFVSLMKANDFAQEGLRYSTLFDFDQSKSIASYETFLTDVVTPLISNNSTVIIHGHTDIIGEDGYNRKLSEERASGARQIIERALAAAGKTGVKFESLGYGEDENAAPFENKLVEERFYNRTVIVDIIPGK